MPENNVFVSTAGDCRYPVVTTEENNLYMTWIASEGKKADLYFRRSINGGNEWSSPQKISNKNSDCFPPAIAVDSGIVHLAWIDYGETVGGEIYYTQSIDGGLVWKKNEILIGEARSACHPLLYCNGKNVYLLWQDGEKKIHFMVSYNRGRIWTREISLGKAGRYSCEYAPPAISVRDRELTVAWTDLRGDMRGFTAAIYGVPVLNTSKKLSSSIVCRRSADNGRTWSKEFDLATTRFSKEFNDDLDNPALLSDGSLSYLFWLDRRNVPLGEIFYAGFDPGTLTDTVCGKNLFPAEQLSPEHLSVVPDRSQNLHLTWTGVYNGKSQIYYGKIDPTGNVLIDKKCLTPDPGRFHNPVITATASGSLQIFWFGTPGNENGLSRIFLTTSSDNGNTWQY
jgi:hypothetical protein